MSENIWKEAINSVKNGVRLIETALLPIGFPMKEMKNGRIEIYPNKLPFKVKIPGADASRVDVILDRDFLDFTKKNLTLTIE